MTVVRNISFFLVAMVFARAVGFIQSFVLAKALGPADFGVWITLLVVVAYVPIISLGVVEALVKKVPYFLGRNEPQQLREIESSVLGSLILSAGLILVLALAAMVVLPFGTIKINPYLAAMWLATIAISYFSAYFYYRFCAHENFKMTGTLDASRSVFSLLFVGGLGWAWGLRGAVAGYFLQEISVLGIAASASIRSYGAPGLTFRKDLIVNAIRVGFPITLVMWVLGLTVTVDRVVLGSMLGSVSVGYYGLGFSVANVLGLLPLVVGRVLYPKVNKHFGQNADVESMKRVVLAPTLALGTLTVNMQAILLVGAPILYCVMLPKYQPGLLAGQILILGSFFASLLRTGSNYLIATNHERVFLKYIAATLAFNVIFDVGLVRAGFGIEGVAVGTSLAGFLLTVQVWRRALTGLGIIGRRKWATMLGLFLPIIVLALAFYCLWAFHSSTFQKPSLTLVPTGILLLVSVNGLLWCFPVYRNEMIAWKNRFQRMRKTRLAPGLANPPELQPADSLEL